MQADAKKFGRVLAVLGLAGLMVVGLTLLLTTLVGAEEPTVGVEILEPNVDYEHVVQSERFLVKANIVVTPSQAVTVTLDWDADDVELVSGDEEQVITPTAYAYDDDVYKKPVEWIMHCITSSREGVTTTITIAAEVAGRETPVTKTIHVVQYPGHPELRVDIVKPTKEKMHKSEVFSVMAEVCNKEPAETALDVEATISLPDFLALVEGESATKFLGDIPSGACHQVMWTVHAKEVSSGGSIVVTAEGRDDVTGDWLPPASDSYWLYVVLPHELTITLDDVVANFDGQLHGENADFKTGKVDEVGIGQVFTVTAIVKNTGMYYFEHNHASIHLDRPDLAEVITGWVEYDGEKSYWDGNLPGDIALDPDFKLEQHETYKVTWVLHCLGAGYVTIDLDAKAEDQCHVDYEVHTNWTVLQKETVVIIYKWPHPFAMEWNWPTADGRRFDLVAKVCNYDDDEHPAIDTSWAEVQWAPGDALDLVEPADPKQTFVSGETLSYGECKPFTWTLECVSDEDPIITVIGGLEVSPGGLQENEDERCVTQMWKPHLRVTILEPEEGHWYGLSNVFPLRVKVENIGEGDARNVYVDVTINGGAVRDSDGAKSFTMSFGTIAGGTSKTQSVNLHCTGPCNVTIRVDPHGTDANIEDYNDYYGTSIPEDIPEANLEWDSVSFHQLPIKVTIDQFPNTVETGQTFGVHAIVENISEECPNCMCVQNVTATIVIEGPASLVPGESPHKVIKQLIKEDEQHAEWTLKCDGPGVVQVYVIAETSTAPTVVPDEGGCPPGAPLGYVVSTRSDTVAIKQVPRLIGYELQLCKDWNFFSLPLIPPYCDITATLRSILPNVVDVWTWNAETGEWEVYVPGKGNAFYVYGGLTKLTEMKDGKGYIIRMNYPDVLKGEGYEDPPGIIGTPPEYPLVEGWNLVGFKTRDFNANGEIDATDVMTAGHYLMNLDTCVGTACGEGVIGDEARFFQSYVCGYPGHWEALDDDDDMRVGAAYWLYASLPDLSIVPPLSQH